MSDKNSPKKDTKNPKEPEAKINESSDTQKQDIDNSISNNNDTVLNENPTVEQEESTTEQQETEQEEYNEISHSAEIEKLNSKIEDLVSSLQKERADFQNYKKRSTEEKYFLEERTAEKILLKLLPSLDTFDAFFLNIEKIEDKDNKKTELVEGVGLIKKQLLEVFYGMGLQEINPKGEEFDPNCMEALASEEKEDIDKEIVEEVYQPGYKIKQRVIRPARIKVMRPKQS